MPESIVFILGSPSASSRSTFVARTIRERVAREGFETTELSLRDFDAADVLFGRVDAEAPSRLVAHVRRAAAVVLASPVYKATYSGGLKAIVDLIPPDALIGRPALGIATTRLADHGVEVARAYRALFSFFRARAVDPLVVLDPDIAIDGDHGSYSAAAEDCVDAAARQLLSAIALADAPRGAAV
jgi:FMN reductase